VGDATPAVGKETALFMGEPPKALQLPSRQHMQTQCRRSPPLPARPWCRFLEKLPARISHNIAQFCQVVGRIK
jgi:hypothetical protein